MAEMLSEWATLIFKMAALWFVNVSEDKNEKKKKWKKMQLLW